MLIGNPTTDTAKTERAKADLRGGPGRPRPPGNAVRRARPPLSWGDDQAALWVNAAGLLEPARVPPAVLARDRTTCGFRAAARIEGLSGQKARLLSFPSVHMHQ
jgi:hypothetical protein